jgi:hypothetical protein
MCNCIEEQRDKLMEGTDIVFLDIKLSTIRSIKEGKFVGPHKTAQAIEYVHPQKKKNGTTINKTVKTFLSHTHCPWCGVKYND